MSANQEFNRQSHRLRGWDYRTPASYFITQCTQDREMYLDDKHVLSIVRKYWREIPKRHTHVELGECEFVHNHMHGIITITRYPESYGVKNHPVCRGAILTTQAPHVGMTPLQTDIGDANAVLPHDYHMPGSVGAIMQGFKIITKRIIRISTKFPYFDWQRDFWDHIIRDEAEYYRIAAYIRDNPAQWETDRNNPGTYKAVSDDVRLPWDQM